MRQGRLPSTAPTQLASPTSPQLPLPNGLEMSRPASAPIVAQTRFAAAGRVGSIELLGIISFHRMNWSVMARIPSRNESDARSISVLSYATRYLIRDELERL